MKKYIIFLAVIFAFNALPSGVFAAMTVDLKVMGPSAVLVDGPLILNAPTDTFSLSLNAPGALTCNLTAPNTFTGVLPNFTSPTPIGPTDLDYPAVGGSTIFSVSCDDGLGLTLSDSVTVTLPTPTIDVQVNASNGPVTLNPGDTYSFTWSSSFAGSCQQVSPSITGLPLTGTSGTITSASLTDYPTAGTPVTVTVNCTSNTTTLSDSVIVQLAGGGGPIGGVGGATWNGGVGGGGSYITPVSTTTVATSTTCLFVKNFMGKGEVNDPVEVMKLQSFFKVFMQYNDVQINGVFDEATYNAVGHFQEAYKDEILTPWGVSEPTHHVYILTLKKINEIYCGQIFSTTLAQQEEIAAYRALVQSLRDQGVQVTPSGTIATSTATTTSVTLPEVGLLESQGQNLRSVGAVLFGLPNSLKDIIPFIIRLLILGFVLYLIIDWFWGVLNRSALKANIKSWYLVVIARLKTILRRGPKNTEENTLKF